VKRIVVALIAGLFLIPGPVQPDSSLLLLPSDLEYLGAFRLPSESDGNTSWNSGGKGMTYYPAGDVSGPDDGYPGSIFGIGHSVKGGVSEFNIPVPVISPNKILGDLNTAQTLQGFYDITEGRHGTDNYVLKGIEYLPAQGEMTEDKIHWCMEEYYIPPFDKPSHSWASLDLSNPRTPGLWHIGQPGEFHMGTTSRYIFEIPKAWSDVNTPGKLLVTGRFRSQAGSFGPTLYTYGPWNNGNPPSDSAYLDAIEMLRYPQPGQMFNGWSSDTTFGFHNADDWEDGAWLTASDKAAVIITGTKALGSICYGTPDVTVECDMYCGGKGYQADDYAACILFYNPDDLAAVVHGEMQKNEPQPYTWVFMDSLMFMSGCTRSTLAGTAYDRAHNLLYISEIGADTLPGTYDTRPLIHVWRVSSPGVAAAPGATMRVKDLNVSTWPNPFNKTAHIMISNRSAIRISRVGLFYTNGKLMHTKRIFDYHAPVVEITFDATSQPAGVYILKINAGSQTVTRRITLLK